MKKLVSTFLATTTLALCAAAAQAAPISYTFTATGNGNLGGTAFTNKSMVFTLWSDTDAVVQAGTFNSSFVTGMTGTFQLGDDEVIDITESIRMHKTNSLLGFRADRGGADFFSFIWAPTTFEFGSNAGPITGKNALRQSNPYLLTELGQLKLTSIATGSASFVSEVARPPADVPEPGTLALLAGGLGGLGCLARARSRSKRPEMA